MLQANTHLEQYFDNFVFFNTPHLYLSRNLSTFVFIRLEENLIFSIDINCLKGFSSLNNPLDISSPEFSTMYCDTNKGVCKAMCGLFDKSGNPPLNNEFGVLNNSHSKHSYCFSKNQECQIGPITYGATINGKQIGHSSINGIPVCTAPGSTQSPRWTSNKDSGFLTAGKTQLFNPDGKTACSKSVSEQTCLNALGKNMYQVNDIEVQDGGCTFEAACNQLPVTFQYPGGKFDDD